MIMWAHMMRICIVITIGHMYVSIIHNPHMVRWRCEVDQRLSSLKGKRREHTKPRSLIQDRRFSKQLGHFCCYLLLYLCGTEILMTAEINSGQARESKQLLSQSLNVSMRSHVIKDNQHSPPSPPF